jgi:putative inorganic carbon (hco3(-)) transporter
MRDLFFVGYLGLLLLFALKRPFLFTLAYAYVDIVAPQRLSYFLLNSVPLSLIIFGFAVLGFLIKDDKQNVRVSPRWGAVVLLLIYCAYTTSVAEQPLEAAEKWAWVWKALFFASFLPLLLFNRLRIEALALTMVLCASALVVTGGLKTLAGGGGYGVLVLLVDINSGLYESSIISCVAIAIIPLILWLANHGTIFKPDWRVKLYATALIFACLLIPIGTQARTGLICIAVLGVMVLRHTKRRMMYMLGVLTVALVSVPFLPSSFTNRMGTIKKYDADESASTRLAVWGWTWEYVKQHPMGGGFEIYRKNRIRYKIENKPGQPQDDLSGEHSVTDSSRAFHSSFFEMLGEQGFFGLFLWLFIHVGGVIRMEFLHRIYRKRNRADETWVAPMAIALQQAQMIYLVGSLFVGIAFQPFVYMLIAMQIGLDTYLSRRRTEAAWKPIKDMRTRMREVSQGN